MYECLAQATAADKQVSIAEGQGLITLPHQIGKISGINSFCRVRDFLETYTNSPSSWCIRVECSVSKLSCAGGNWKSIGRVAG
jgi:hypothetical protein